MRSRTRIAALAGRVEWGVKLFAEPFVAQGIAVANVNYDLCPDVPVATIVLQVRRAVAWLTRTPPRAPERKTL